MLALRVRARAGRRGAGGPVGDPEFDRNAALLRDGYAAFARGDLDAVLGLVDPQFVTEVHTGRPDLPELPVFHGREGMLENWREVTEPFEEVELEAERFEGTAERMIVAVRMAGRGKASGAPFEIRIFHAWAMREGTAVRLDIYSDLEEARAGRD